MDTLKTTMACQLADAASASHQQRTGHTPHSATVAMGEDTLVITLHGALSLAERVAAQSAAGAAQVQDFHRRLFAASSDALRQEIKRITGVPVREAATEVEPPTGAVVHVFTSGSMVQVFHLARHLPVETTDAEPFFLNDDAGNTVGSNPLKGTP